MAVYMRRHGTPTLLALPRKLCGVLQFVLLLVLDLLSRVQGVTFILPTFPTRSPRGWLFPPALLVVFCGHVLSGFFSRLYFRGCFWWLKHL
jgi:hypothetical protein